MAFAQYGQHRQQILLDHRTVETGEPHHQAAAAGMPDGGTDHRRGIGVEHGRHDARQRVHQPGLHGLSAYSADLGAHLAIEGQQIDGVTGGGRQSAQQ